MFLEPNVYVSASIPENNVTIYGYTSPLAKVELNNSKVYALTFSDNTGYFEFKNTYIPKNSPELCLVSTNEFNQSTTPLCPPPPPPTNYHTDIGPLILPPTIAINSDTIKPNQTIVASGQSLPNSPIDIYLYQVNNRAPIFPKAVSAFSLPVFSTITDSLGNYSFSLPTAYSSNYRLFASVKYDSQPSPKSNTIIYYLPSLFYLFWLQNYWLIITLPLFVLSLTFFFYLIHLYYLRPKFWPAIFSYPLVLNPPALRAPSLDKRRASSPSVEGEN